MTLPAKTPLNAVQGASSFGAVLEVTCASPLTGSQLADLCRECEREKLNIHQLLYLVYDDETSAMLRLTLDAAEAPASLLTLLERFG